MVAPSSNSSKQTIHFHLSSLADKARLDVSESLSQHQNASTSDDDAEAEPAKHALESPPTPQDDADYGRVLSSITGHNRRPPLPTRTLPRQPKRQRLVGAVEYTLASRCSKRSSSLVPL